MSARKWLIAALICFTGTAAVAIGVHLAWKLKSQAMIRSAGPPAARPGRDAIWRDPGDVAALDMAAGPGGPDGAPAPPLRFLEEEAGSTSPKVFVEDARGRKWRLKWGGEIHSETFAVRVAWAAGYFAETTYFVPAGRIENVPRLEHAADFVRPDGTFEGARFELVEKGVERFKDERSWAWTDNPFVNTRELAGLKVVMMLVSNWDDKDVRDAARGSNTAVFEVELPDGSVERRYLVSDWGGSMGRWGIPLTRGKWDCEGYAAQTPDFVKGVEGDAVRWGYEGQRTEEMTERISVNDVRWIHGYLGRLTDAQIRDALRASGATDEETECFARSVRARIDRLGEVAAGAPN